MGNSIEEDIILLKDFTEGNFKRDKLENYKGSYKMGYFYYKDIQQAIEHILSDYKRVLKENEELLELKVSASAHNRILELEKENEELKNDYENLSNSVVVKNHCIKNSIPVSLVKDKIEELNKKEKKELKGMKGQDRYFVKQTYQNKRMILQELIEEREK